MKTCPKCNSTKEEGLFFKNNAKKDKLSVYCKECISKYRKEKNGNGKLSCTKQQLEDLIAKVMEEYSEDTRDACERLAEDLGMNYKSIRWGPGIAWPAYRLAMILLLDEDPGRANEDR